MVNSLYRPFRRTTTVRERIDNYTYRHFPVCWVLLYWWRRLSAVNSLANHICLYGCAPKTTVAKFCTSAYDYHWFGGLLLSIHSRVYLVPCTFRFIRLHGVNDFSVYKSTPLVHLPHRLPRKISQSALMDGGSSRGKQGSLPPATSLESLPRAIRVHSNYRS